MNYPVCDVQDVHARVVAPVAVCWLMCADSMSTEVAVPVTWPTDNVVHGSYFSGHSHDHCGST